MTNVLVLGSNYITSAIVRSLLYIPDIKITIVDRRDPHYVLNQHLMAGIQALAESVPDLTKNIPYKKGFRYNSPTDSLSFLFLNPITDSLKLYEELVKVPSIDIVVDSAMMFDPFYSENNLIDTCNTNAQYPTAIFSILSKLNTPQLYINLSSGIVYGKQPPGLLPLNAETVIPHPVGMRAGSLLARESIVSSLATAYEIPYITLRIGTPIGYYTPEENVINQVVKAQLLNKPITIEGTGHQARDFFALTDLSNLIHRIVSNVVGAPLPPLPQNQQSETDEKKERLTGYDYIESIQNRVYNVGGHKTKNEAPFSLITLDRIITTALGKIKIPEEQGKIIIKSSKMRNLPWRHLETIEKDVMIQLDNETAIKYLDYDPQYNILDTIKTEVIPYVADNFLNYTEEQMADLKKTLKL